MSRAVALALASLMLLSSALGAGVAWSHSAAPAGSDGGTLAPVRLFPHPPAVRALGPAATSYWYTQEGAVLGQVNGSSASTELTSLVEQLTLVTSAYPIGYELNGLSSSGDWYQVLVTDNWSGCNSGFEMTYEVWDNTGATQTPVCDPTLTLSSGDVVKLALELPSLSRVCLDVSDLTTGHAQADCQSQPDSGAQSFQLLTSGSNANGYFTGPMTEIGNPNLSACPDYTKMPVVDYRWPTSFRVTEYLPFSDEFQVGGAYTYCYSSSAASTTIGAGDPTSHDVDTASGTSFGPHHIDGQNLTYLDSSFGFRLVTDPTPLQGVYVSPSAKTVSLGTVVTLDATVSGGTAPHSALWSVDGSFSPSMGLQFNYTAAPAGSHTVAAYGVDALDLVNGPSTSTITVPGILAAGPIAASTATNGADVGQAISIASQVTGGLPPYQFTWSGLPSSCPAQNAPSLPCTPSATGTFTVGLSVLDSNGTTVRAPSLSLVVAASFEANLQVSRPSLDVGQSVWVNMSVGGGAVPVTYSWTGLGPDCFESTNGSFVECSPTSQSPIAVAVHVSDHNGESFSFGPLNVPVSLPPTIQLLPSRTSADAGVSLTLTVHAAGGLDPILYVWWGLPPTCPTTVFSSTVICAFPAGPATIWVNVTDGNRARAGSGPVSLGIYPPLQGSAQGGGNVVLGGTLTLDAIASGGSGGLQYTWQNLPPGCFAPAGGSLSCAPEQIGSYNVTVLLSDAGGGHATVSAIVNVVSPPPPPAPTVPLYAWAVAAAAVVLVVGLLTAAAVVGRRRRSG